MRSGIPFIPKRVTIFFFGACAAYAAGGRYFYDDRKSQGNTVIEQKKVEDKKLDFTTTVEGNNGHDYSVMKRSDIGVETGFAVQIAKGILIETRYSFGFTNLAQSSKIEPKNRSFSFSFVFPTSLTH